MPEDRLDRNLPAVIPDSFRAPYTAVTASQPPGWDPEPDAPAVPLSHYLWILKRHRWKILPFVAASVLSTLIVSSRLTPIYEGRTTIDVDRQTPTGLVGQDATRITSNDAEQFLATQVRLI